MAAPPTRSAECVELSPAARVPERGPPPCRDCVCMVCTRVVWTVCVRARVRVWCGLWTVCMCACVVRGVCVHVCASCACGTRPPFEHLPGARSRGQLTGAITGWLSGRCRLDRFSLSPLCYRSAFLLSPQLLLGVGCRRQVQAGPLHSAAARSGVSCPPPGLCAAGRRGVLPPGWAPSCPAHGRDLTSGLRAQARPGWGRLCAEVGLGG